MNKKTHNNFLVPYEAEVVKRIQESPSVYSLVLRFTDSQHQENYSFEPGQFNMLYLYGVGEVAISIVADPEMPGVFQHTIRAVGRVTNGLSKLKAGNRLGIRGPFGRGWPMEESKGKDVFIVTGGLGCAPVIAAIHNIFLNREHFGAIKILQGVKNSHDFIFDDYYAKWQKRMDAQVLLAADAAGPKWPWHKGFVINLIEQLQCCSTDTVAFICGPEPMMKPAVKYLKKKCLPERNIYLSMERNMACAVGHCGHCQYGGKFICKDGPVFSYPEIKMLFEVDGF